VWNSVERFGKIAKDVVNLKAFAKAVKNKRSERYTTGNSTLP